MTADFANVDESRLSTHTIPAAVCPSRRPRRRTTQSDAVARVRNARLSATIAQGAPRPTVSSPATSNGYPTGKDGVPGGCAPCPSVMEDAICRYDAESVSSRRGLASWTRYRADRPTRLIVTARAEAEVIGIRTGRRFYVGCVRRTVSPYTAICKSTTRSHDQDSEIWRAPAPSRARNAGS